MKTKLVVIGASYLQRPLIERARQLGIETHVFAWEHGAVAKGDYFYPLSITDKDAIVERARQIRPDGIATIASDLAVVTVNYVANRIGLIANSDEVTLCSTNKRLMRERLSARGLPCPRFACVDSVEAALRCDFDLPMIIKPTDRSGSRGVTKITERSALPAAVARSLGESIEKKVLIEEFVEGDEISVETISWKGQHHCLAITDKQTTGAPYFVEIGHQQPTRLSDAKQNEVLEITRNALDSLGIQFGASHSELLIRPDGRPCIVEIGARMGGDFIGSHLVELSTGYDFVRGVIEVALGNFSAVAKTHQRSAGIRYLVPPDGVVRRVVDNTASYPEIIQSEIFAKAGDLVHAPRESADRLGYYIYASRESFAPQTPPLQIVVE